MYYKVIVQLTSVGIVYQGNEDTILSHAHYGTLILSLHRQKYICCTELYLQQRYNMAQNITRKKHTNWHPNLRTIFLNVRPKIQQYMCVKKWKMLGGGGAKNCTSKKKYFESVWRVAFEGRIWVVLQNDLPCSFTSFCVLRVICYR